MTIPAPNSPLVDIEWLKANLGDDDLLVVDTSCHMSPGRPGGYVSLHEQYLQGHIPGAVFADVVDALSDPEAVLPLTRPGSERLAGAFVALDGGLQEGRRTLCRSSRVTSPHCGRVSRPLLPTRSPAASRCPTPTSPIQPEEPCCRRITSAPCSGTATRRTNRCLLRFGHRSGQHSTGVGVHGASPTRTS